MRHFRSVFSVVVLITLLSPVTLLGQGDTPLRVAKVVVEGNKQMSLPAILAHIKTAAGVDYDEAMVKSDERRLLKTGKFAGVVASRTISQTGVIVTFTVVERPLVAAVSFEGNKSLKYEKLAAELTFSTGDALNRFAVEAGIQAIEDKYKSEGYNFASVTVDWDALETSQEVVYRIIEGGEVTVRKIKFEGNDHFGNFKLKQTIGSSARFWPVIVGRLDMEQVDLDVQAIRNLYIDDGFLNAEVGRLIDFSDDKSKATLRFVINEGQRFRINRVIFEGNKLFSDTELAARLYLTQGKFLTAVKLRRDVEVLQDTYGEVGYVEASVTTARRFLDPTAPLPAWTNDLDETDPGLLNMIFRVVERDQYHVGRIDVRGNDITQGRVIRRQLRFYPQQLVNMVAVDESENRILDTRLFDEVTITPVIAEPGVRDMLVEVSETETANFMIGAGVNTNSGLVGNISLTERNFDITRWPTSWSDAFSGRAFRGGGQTFRMSAEPGVEMMRFQIEWFEPYLFDKPYSLGTKGYLFSRDRDNYDETRYGGVVSVGHRFKNRWYGEVAGRAEGVKIDSLDDNAPPEVIEDSGSHVIAGVKGTLVKDRTDSRWMPSRGDRFRLSYEQVMGDYNFGRATGDYRIYRTLYLDGLDRKHILAGRASVGRIFGDAPVFESFYGGGIGSIRGFGFRGISPRSSGMPGKGEPIGGEFMIFIGTEYTFPLFGDQLRGAVFLDTGTVEADVEVTTYRAAIGVGIRWSIPLFGQVPMSLDFAVPINDDDDDDGQLLNFSFGMTF